MLKDKILQTIHIALRLVIQTVLLFGMLNCILFASSSFYTDRIMIQLSLYTLALGLLSVLFLKLAANKAHKHVSYYMVLFTTIIWLVAMLHGIAVLI